MINDLILAWLEPPDTTHVSARSTACIDPTNAHVFTAAQAYKMKPSFHVIKINIYHDGHVN
jgi:hypothetical protein